ncbi:MAG: nucleolar protein 56 [Candidatus Woesearchaeota archaeon]|nr:nucleolar protein 56 [Candidatus Woesearchaeota archaeon]
MKTLYSLPFGLFVFEDNEQITFHQIDSSEAIAISKGEFLSKEQELIKKYNIKHIVAYKNKAPADLSLDFSEENMKIVARLADENYKEAREKAISIFKANMKERQCTDLIISNTIKAIDEADLNINQLSKRAEEIISQFLPETFYHPASSSINYQRIFSDLASLSYEELNEKAKQDEIGADIPKDAYPIIKEMLNSTLNAISYRKNLLNALDSLLKDYCPNLVELLGPSICARLISEAGSLKRLAFLPSSTIQLLGAENAFFRYLKSKTKCPKYGHILQHQFVQNQPKKKRGKAARFLADKISICARCDYFSKERIVDDILAQMMRFD